MNNITLFVGSNDRYLSECAIKFDKNSWLVDSRNFSKFLDISQDTVAYTSMADLPKITQKRNVFFDVLDHAGTIFYCPPQQWPDHCDDFSAWSEQTMTEYLLSTINKQKGNVKGLVLPSWTTNPYLQLFDVRRTQSPQLWVSGCSISHGVGVNPNEKFGAILSNKLQLPVSFLTTSGTSIPWAADQLLRSDIKAGDFVVWGITSEYRSMLFDRTLLHKNLHSFSGSESRNIGSNLQDLVFKAVMSIHQVVNFCRSVNATLIMLPVLSTEQLGVLMHDCPDWHCMTYQAAFLDVGRDNVHPGPLQHARWAEFCYAVIQKTTDRAPSQTASKQPRDV
jgi:hypothetical protein